MKKILFTFEKGDPTHYLRALEQAGMEGVLCTEGTDPNSFDGLLLCGGGDVDPSLYGEANNGSYGISKKRDQMDLACIHSFILEGKPILGICRGIQILNVAFGGSLVQHLSNANSHMAVGGDVYHEVHAKGILRQLYGRTFMVNCCHHQGIDRLGRGLHPIAFSRDGCIEGIIHQTLPILAVQFHPERMEHGAPIFRYFSNRILPRGKDPQDEQ